MANLTHGINNTEKSTAVSAVAEVDSGITFAVGTAPIHTVGGAVNGIIMANSYEEAVSALGYSDDWEKFTLCEVMYNHFKLFMTGPVIFVNVLNPAEHKKSVEATDVAYSDGKALLPITAINDSTLVVKAGDTSLVKDTDYVVSYNGENLVIAGISGGAIPSGTNSLSIAYTVVDPSKVDGDDIIGGVDLESGKKSGFELINDVFTKYHVIPELLIAPGYSHIPEVAAVMGTKALPNGINGLFKGLAILDVDTSSVKKYSDVPEWKKTKNINGTNQILCFPMVKLGEKKFHLSTQIAALIAVTDSNNDGVPSDSPSNKSIHCDSAVLADGTELNININEADYLNKNGIVTALNFINGFTAWGNTTACFPANTDVKDYFINVNRMFSYLERVTVMSYWRRIDEKMTRKLIDSIVDSINIWLNGLTADGDLLGGRVEYRAEENPQSYYLAGKAVFHYFIAIPTPAQELEFIYEFDTSYIE